MAQQVAGIIPMQKPTMGQNLGAGAAAGLAAGQSQAPAYDDKSAAMEVFSGTASGAAAGGTVGGPWGAVIGGGIGAVTSGLNAWMQLEGENKRKSELQALTREIEEKQNALDKRDRADALSALSYNRKEVDMQKAWGMVLAKRDQVNSLINQNTAMRGRFISTGVQHAYA